MKLLIALYYYLAFFSYVAIFFHNILLTITGDLSIAVGGAGLITSYLFGAAYIKLFTGMSFLKSLNESRYFIIGYLYILISAYFLPMMVITLSKHSNPQELAKSLFFTYITVGILMHLILAFGIFKYYADIYQIERAIYEE